MADGTRTPIEEVEVGDRVVASDPETGERAAQEVTHVWAHEDTVVDLVVQGDVITTTEDHPFWNATEGRFQRADQLDAGDEVLTADGRSLSVSGLAAASSRSATAYNLAVADIHTYHVGQTDVLVHNRCDAEGERLGGRVDQIHGALDRHAQSRRTTAVLSTRQGRDVIASGGRDLNPAQRALARIGDLLARRPGAHAEVTALAGARGAGLSPWRMIVSRRICSSCQTAITRSGGRIDRDGKGASWPR